MGRNTENQLLRKSLAAKEEELRIRRKTLGLPPEEPLARPGSALARPVSARRPRTAEETVEAILGLGAETLGEADLRARNSALRAEISKARDRLMGLRAGALSAVL